jgi:energy-coupling factor transport system permease protein
MVIGISIFIMHPIIIAVSFFSSLIYSIKLNGKTAVKFNFYYMIPVMLISAAFNPIFVHEGATVLAYFFNGNPLTLESIVYGAASSAMLVSVIIWFSCFNYVMSSDKLIFLFGRIMPGMSLIISMVLRLVPKYKAQIKNIANGQRCIGRDISKGRMIDRARYGLKILSIMLTWALENGVDTADSMKSRGYGLRGRTSFSNYRFDSRDKKAVFAMFIIGIVLIYGMTLGYTSIRFYPTVKMAEFTNVSFTVYIFFGILCCMPVIIDFGEELKWKYLKLTA